MPSGDSFVLFGIGGVFVVFGLVGLIWGRHEEKRYFESLAGRPDVREFMAHWPERPQPGALKTGGWIAVAVGLVMLVAGTIFWLFS